MPHTVALIVANDPGTGFERSKYLEPVRGVPMIERIVAKAADWPVDEVMVVLGPDADEIISTADLGEATIVIDPEWKEGIAASLRVGIDLLLRGGVTDRIVLALGDQPGVEGETVAALLESPSAAVVPKYRYRRGFPVVLSSDLWDQLLGLEGPVDVHDLLESHPAGVEEVWFDRLEPSRLAEPADFSSPRGRG
jgi:CTP:molybdopterin cytidylyltransferase MocA